MVSSPNNHSARFRSDADDATAHPAVPLRASRPPRPVNTDQYPAHRTYITTTLSQSSLPTTRAKLPTVIPAPRKRRRTIPTPPPAPRRHRPLVLISMIVSCAAILSIVFFWVAPLGNGQHPQSIFNALQGMMDSGSSASFEPSQHLALPAPTLPPPSITNEGYCGGTDLWGTCATAVVPNGLLGTGQMASPIQGAVITQVFGHNEYQIVCGCYRPHTGIDLAAAYGTPITASDSGQVLWAGWDWTGLGWAVKINHGHYIATVYGHLARFIVKVGENVTKGQVIAYEGSTGASTGPHVHFMVIVNNIWVDPTLYMALP